MRRTLVVLAVVMAGSLALVHRRAETQVPRLQKVKLLIGGDACYGPCKGPLCCALVVVQ